MNYSSSTFSKVPGAITLLFLVLTLINQPLKAQASDYNLLWQISGKNLKGPSYLFGTMHLTDKRIFNFPDSLWIAIEACDQFAVEIDLNNFTDDLCTYLNETMTEDGEDSFPVPAPENRMSTIIDAYLMQYAKSLNKRTTGLEKIEDQVEHMSYYEEDFEYTDELIEQYIQLYQAGNLEKMMTAEEVDMLDDPIMLKRNSVMADGIDSILQSNTLFSAVGAAHLYGKGSVVDLLEQKGYSLRPVTATFSNRKIEPRILLEKPMIKHTNADWGIRIEMPHKPCKLESSEFEMEATLDFGAGLYYLLMAFPMPELEKEALEETYSEILKNTGEVLSEKTIKYKGISGKEALVYAEENGLYFSYRLFTKDGLMYMIAIGSTYDGGLKKLSKPYFNSVEFLAIPNTPKVTATGYPFESMEGAYRVNFPVESGPNVLVRNQELEEESLAITVHQQLGIDMANFVIFGTQYFVLPRDRYTENMAEEFEQNLLNAQIKSGSPENLLEFETTTFADYPCSKIRYRAEGRYNTIKSIHRGNKIYQVLIISQEEIGFDHPFFDSFEFLPLQQEEWKPKVVGRDNFSILFPPSQFEIIDTNYTTDFYETSIDNIYIGKDTLSGVIALIEYFNYSDFIPFETEIDTFYQALKEQFVDSTDIILEELSDSLKNGKKYTISTKDSTDVLRMKSEVYFSTQAFYRVMLGYPPELEKSTIIEEYFNSFTITDPNFYAIKDYGTIALNYIVGQDTFFREKVLRNIADVPFEAKHAKRMENLILEQKISKDNLRAFLNAYASIPGPEPIQFLIKQFNAHTDKTDQAIDYLSVFRSYDIENGSSYFFDNIKKVKLTKEQLFKSSLISYFGYTYEDFPDFYDQLLALSSEELYKESFISALRAASFYFETTEEFLEFANNKKSDFNKLLEDRLAARNKVIADTKQIEELDNQIINLLDVLDNAGIDESNRPLVQKTLGLSRNVNFTATKILIDEKVELDPAYIQMALQDSIRAYKTCKQLEDTKQLEVYLKKGVTLDTTFIAMSELSYLIYDYDYYRPEAITLYDTMNLEVKGKPGVIYLFEYYISSKEGKKRHLGISGPYPIQHDEKTDYNYLTDFTYTTFDGTNGAAIIKEILDRYEEVTGYE